MYLVSAVLLLIARDEVTCEKDSFRPLNGSRPRRRGRQFWPTPSVLPVPINEAFKPRHELRPLIYYLPEKKPLSCYTCCKEKSAYYRPTAPSTWVVTTPSTASTWVITYSTFPTKNPWKPPPTRTTTRRPWYPAPTSTYRPRPTTTTYYRPRPTTTTRRPTWRPTQPWNNPNDHTWIITTKRTTTQSIGPGLPINEIEVIDARKGNSGPKNVVERKKGKR